MTIWLNKLKYLIKHGKRMLKSCNSLAISALTYGANFKYNTVHKRRSKEPYFQKQGTSRYKIKVLQSYGSPCTVLWL